MTPHQAELTHLCSLLRIALRDPSRLRSSVARFLEAFDALPDGTDAHPDASWAALRDAAYDLRYYAPDEVDDDSVLLDDRAALQRIRETVEHCSERLPQN